MIGDRSSPADDAFFAMRNEQFARERIADLERQLSDANARLDGRAIRPSKESHLVMNDAETGDNVIIVISDAEGEKRAVFQFDNIRDADAMFRCLLEDIGYRGG